jgi:hypothetical protein
MIRNRESGWEKFVPHKVEEAIKDQKLFDYEPPIEIQSSSNSKLPIDVG